MIQTAEQIIESIRALPEPERSKLLSLAEAEAKRTIRPNGKTEGQINKSSERFRQTQQWIDEHKDEYDGQFVVLHGDRLVASGSDSKAVYEEALAQGYKSPFLKRIKAKTLPFGGW